jgi:hypothetical protein
MGYIRHNAIIVTGSDCTDIGGKHDTLAARDKAIDLGLPCSEIVRGTTNGYTSFLIAPDGSKEGWQESKRQDELRAKWIEWARASGHGFDWALISFGGDDAELAMLEDWNLRERNEFINQKKSQ